MTSETMLTSYGRRLDGLYTYCLSVLCERPAAVAAVLEVRELARGGGAGRIDPALHRAWLYSAARYACVRRLSEAGGAVADELAGLAWPEAAGLPAEQREALELSLRHGLDEAELAAVLDLPAAEAARLLAAARAELAATRRALLVLACGGCPELARLGGTGGGPRRPPVLGPALRRELVGHLAGCPTCRGIADRAEAPAAEPRLLPAPDDLHQAFDPTTPLPQVHFDPDGFPRHRAPGRLRRHGCELPARLVLMRQRALTTGVLAAVLAAPLTALWMAHQGDTTATGAATVSSVRVDTPAPAPGPQDDDTTAPLVPLPTPTPGTAIRGVPAALVETTTNGAETLLPPVLGPAVPVPAPGAVPLSSPLLSPVPLPAASALRVEAAGYGKRTVLTLTNTGTSALDWHAVVSCDWLRLSRDSGTLEPGQRITVIVTVDDQRAPVDDWAAQISLPPSQAVVTLTGGPGLRGVPTPVASSPSGFTPSPSANPSGSASAIPSDGASAGSSASTAPSSSASPSASPTSGPPTSPSPTSPSPSATGSSITPSAQPTVAPTPSGPTSASTPGSTTSTPSPSSPAR
ncbi:hypothetical protein E6W39_24620 [Kitasatospora acidiphila]|uniref:BACON domain-containing protein n=1 Tax=Kitasatospora acidiphila TaxID=2567942 RepID=A0A540W721_9ACTN|nr:hypothetical protein [Kitasatospora acidiphila]TQF04828.1 hypothetical protein E6W39_24620 [Kitasatospora acidiphila]